MLTIGYPWLFSIGKGILVSRSQTILSSGRGPCSTSNYWHATLPERTPANVVLAQVFKLGRFDDELVDLGDDLEFLVWLEVAARELLVDAVEHLDCACVLQLGRVAAKVCQVVTVANAIRDDARVGARPGPRVRRGTSELLLLLLRHFGSRLLCR